MLFLDALSINERAIIKRNHWFNEYCILLKGYTI